MRHPLDSNGILLAHAESERAQVFTWGSGEVALLSRRSPDKDGPNEDAALVAPLAAGALLLAVADGCGGMPAGDEAAARALGALGETCRVGEDGDLTGALIAGFDAANRAVLDMRMGAGATLAAVLIEGDVARVVHAGDSLALITGQRGSIRFVAKPHSPTGRGMEAGLMTEDEALAHDDRSVVLNVVGSPEMFVEIGPPTRLSRRDTVLLASDGLSDNMLTGEIATAIRIGRCVDAVDAVAGVVGGRMGPGGGGHADDLTVVVYRPLAHAVG